MVFEEWSKENQPRLVYQPLPLHVFEEWNKLHSSRETQGLLLHHNDVSTHTAAATPVFLVEIRVNLVTRPPYSSDLAPGEWFLFLFIKKPLRRIQVQSPEDARAYFEGVIFVIPQSTWPGVTDRRCERMIKCINAEVGRIHRETGLVTCELIEPPRVDSCSISGSQTNPHLRVY